MSCSTLTQPQTITVGMGQTLIARAPDRLASVLGSCIGVALHHPRLRIAAFAHVVLPDSAGRGGTPGKYADTAIPYLIDLLKAEGANSTGLVAKLAGGASMFAASGPLQVGLQNLDAVRAALVARSITVIGEHVGGAKGRRVLFDPVDGQLTIEIVGAPVATL